MGDWSRDYDIRGETDPTPELNDSGAFSGICLLSTMLVAVDVCKEGRETLCA